MPSWAAVLDLVRAISARRVEPAHRLLLGRLVMYTGIAALFPVVPLYVRAHGGSAADVALFVAGPMVAATLVQIPAGHLVDRVGRKPILVWSTVVGNRVDCASTCWIFASTPLGTATPAGGALQTAITVPDGLGGWHVVQLMQNGQLVAQVPFYVQESIVGQGVSSLVVKEGQSFTIHLKGVGWTQLDNTVGVDYDNSYIGYGCGFNSNGDVVLHLNATGGPGVHLIDMYPMLYSLSPSFAQTPYGMVPVLSYARDYPGLALGYHMPAIRLAITVIK